MTPFVTILVFTAVAMALIVAFSFGATLHAAKKAGYKFGKRYTRQELYDIQCGMEEESRRMIRLIVLWTVGLAMAVVTFMLIWIDFYKISTIINP